jgi:hypothetical protein
MFSRYNSGEDLDTAGLNHVIVQATQKTAASNFPDAHLTTLSTVWRLIATQSDHPVANALQLAFIFGIGRCEVIEAAPEALVIGRTGSGHRYARKPSFLNLLIRPPGSQYVSKDQVLTRF